MSVRTRAHNYQRGTEMRIRMMGAALCLLGAAYTANAGYSWSEFKAEGSVTKQPAARTTGYSWSELRAGDTNAPKSAAKTHGYSWSELRAGDTNAPKSAAKTHGY